MSDTNDGGSAFPIPLDDRPGAYAAETGMSLRDYFAAAALQGFVANKDRPTVFDPADDARYVYALADAMLKERAK